MKKFIFLLSIVVFITTAFGQNNSKKTVILPKDAEYANGSGDFEHFGETGSIDSKKGRYEFGATVFYFVDKATAKSIMIAHDFKKERLDEYNGQRQNQPNTCCIKFTTVRGGTLAYWADTHTYYESPTDYEANLFWEGIISTSLVTLQVHLSLHVNNINEVNLIAETYLDEMISNAEKSDFKSIIKEYKKLRN